MDDVQPARISCVCHIIADVATRVGIARGKAERILANELAQVRGIVTCTMVVEIAFFIAFPSCEAEYMIDQRVGFVCDVSKTRRT